MSSESWVAVVVVDNGSATLRAGYSGDDEPRLQWPNVVATPKSEEQQLAFDLKDRYIGEDAQRERGRLALNCPMKGGLVSDWEAMEQMWQAAFQRLEADPIHHYLLMSDRPLTPLSHRERMTETMFETFQVPGFYVMNQGVLCTFSTGRETAVVVDCGEGATTVMPVEKFSIRPHAIYRGDVSGADLTEYLRTSMMQRGYDFMDQGGLDAARELKESLCYVSDDFKGDMARAQEVTSSSSCGSSPLETVYELPDGQRVTLNEDRVRVPEALFQPALLGRCGEGVPELLYNSIRMCDIDSRKNLFLNIIPVGGSACFPGFNERLQKEVEELVPDTVKVKVENMEVKMSAAFLGASCFASLSTFHSCSISKQEYEEHGPHIVHRICT